MHVQYYQGRIHPFQTTDFRACQYELLCPESAEVDEELMTPTYQEN